MNKNRYRIVFNKARNLMMAVAENTTSQGKGQQSGSVRSSSSHPDVAEAQLGAKVIELLQLKPIAFAALCMFGLQPVLLHAAVTADANADANNRPLIEATANGLPLVQITAPSAAGVSRNQYSQFNVDPSGVILNNSQVNVLTQQGGYVNGNANLANGSARIILNEVTGTGPSSLRGYTEVAGQRAEVIIANPNGIVCDSCGFINTSRGILTTGVPVMSGGSLDSFRVTGEEITIGAGGLNASNTDQLDLITRSLQVNGEIWANNLNAIIGTNQVDYTTLGVQVITGIASEPTVRIDVALLGGMYANKIRLVGTEAGVGVNSLGTIAAQAGDFSLDNKGKITLSGRTNATGNVAITTTGDISNTGTLEGNTITTNSNAFNNSSEVLADVIAINAATFSNQTADAKISANISADLLISGDITNQGMIQGYNVTTTSNDFTNTGAVLGSAVKINAANLYNKDDAAVIAATDKIDLIVSNSVSNTDGATIWSLGNLNAAKSSELDAKGYLKDNMVSFTNSSGTVQADGDLRISADQITNKKTAFEVGQTVVVGDQVNIGLLHYIPTITTDFVKTDSDAAMLLSGGNMWLNGNINNDYSIVTAGGNISFNGVDVLKGDPLPANSTANGFAQKSYLLKSVETQVGAKDGVWGVTGGYNGVCSSWGVPYNCWKEVEGWISAPESYANTVTTLFAPSLQTGSASFTAGGNLTGIVNTIINLNNGSASTTLGAIQSATPVAGNPNPPALNITLPKNGLFHYNSSPNPAYLIESNPRFANYQNFISSDFMLSRLNLDPAQTQKRLGDGFYEQKLVSDQITGLTGRRFLPGYTSAEAEFKALMVQGLSEAHAQNLIPGVTLTTAQVAALTHDIVWMVAQEVHLADGTTEKLLVPQVFLTRLHENDLRPNGSLIAAENINLKASGTLLNSGTILGSRTNTVNATDIINQGTLGSGGDTVLVAGNDIKNLSGHISGVRVAVLAGHDIVNETEIEELQLGNVFTTRIHNTSTLAATDSLDMQAGRDISVSGANIASGGNTSMAAGNNLNINAKTASESAALVASSGVNGGISRTTHLTSQVQTGGDLSLQANNDIQLAAAQINAQHKMYVAAKNINLNAVKDTRQSSFSGYGLVKRNYDEQVTGSSLQAGGDITLVASRKTDSSDDHRDDHRDEQHSTGETRKGEERNTKGNINIGGSQISSQSGKISLTADNNVTVNAVDERHESFEQRTSSSSGFFSSSSTTEIKTSNEKIARGSSIEGDSMSVKTGNSINVIGSDLVASHDLSLTAKNNISLLASQNTYTSGYFKEEKKSGFMSGEGLSISYGDQKQTNLQTSTDISHTASNVGSLNGKVNIKAGKDYTQSGSNVLAPEGDISIAAQEVLINEVQNTGASHSETKFEKTGLTLSISNAVVDAANNIDQQSKASSKTSSGRMKALAVANALMSTNNAVGEVMKGMDGGMMDKAGGVTVSLSIGGSTSESSSTQTHSQAQGSSVTAKGNINIVATSGDDDDTHRTEKENARDDHDHHNELNKPKRGNITIQGSDIKAGNNTSLEAENDINLLAAKSTAEQHSTNSSSSGSIGVSGSSSGKVGYTASASIGRGNADGSDVTWTNTHVDAGNTLTLKSGPLRQAQGNRGDLNIRGAVASGKQVVAEIGGNLNIESLQDTSVYDSKQKSEGGSITVGAGAGGSINLSGSNINSNYASVMEQSGIKAGDGGYKVKVKGNTDLKGAVIAASDEGLRQSTFETGGTLTQSDIQNSASYDAEAYAVSAGTSAGSTSAGLGEDSGNASSTTKSGIGVSTKTDTTGAIAKIFDADKVTEEVNAQAQITQSFSKQVPKAVADYAASRTKPYTDATDYKTLNDKQKQGELSEADQKRLSVLEKQGLTPDSAQATLNDPQSKKDYDNWKEGGSARVALHTITNALSGGINGATGALVSASAAPLMDELQANVQTSLAKSMGPQAAQMVAKAVADLTATGMGYAAGGVQGAGSALTVDANNRQLGWDKFMAEKDKCRNSPGATGCGTIDKMAGKSQQIVDFLALPTSKTVANIDANGQVVSYTILDKDTNKPMMIMEPAEYQAYRGAGSATQGWYLLSPQWSLDIGSANVYAGQGDFSRAFDYLGDAISSPEYWATMGLGTLGGILSLPTKGTGVFVAVEEMAETSIYRGVAINGANRTVPLGFQAEPEFLTAAKELQTALRNSGIDDAVVGVRGSSVTGYSITKGTQFGPQSDIDFFIESVKITDGYTLSKNIPGFVHPNKILPDYPALQDWSAKWTNNLGRDVTPGAFVPGSLPVQPSILVK